MLPTAIMRPEITASQTLQERQLWNLPTAVASSPTVSTPDADDLSTPFAD